MSEAGFACPVCAAPMDHVGWMLYACPDGHGTWSPEQQGPPPQELCPTCRTASLPTVGSSDGVRRCTACGCEVWPPRGEYMRPSPDREAAWAWRDEQRRARQMAKPGGGSKSGRRRKKPRPAQRPWNEEGA